MANDKSGARGEAQHERFKEAARALGCDEDGAAFDETPKANARPKPKNEPPHPAPLRKAAPRKAK